MAELTNAEPIVFDAAAARDLAARFRATAQALPRRSRTATALPTPDRPQGVYEARFRARMQVCSTDGERLAEALDTAATQVTELVRLAQEEQDRRTVARAWKVEHDAWMREQEDRNLREKGLHCSAETTSPSHQALLRPRSSARGRWPAAAPATG